MEVQQTIKLRQNNTPFHRSLSRLSATAAGGNLTYLAWICISICPSHLWLPYFFSLCVHVVCVHKMGEFEKLSWALFHCNCYGVMSCLDDRFSVRSFNLSTDPHHSVRKDGRTKSKRLAHTVFTGWPVWPSHQCLHLSVCVFDISHESLYCSHCKHTHKNRPYPKAFYNDNDIMPKYLNT